MPHIRPWLLAATPFLWASVVSCAVAEQASRQPSAAGRSNLVIDIKLGLAEAPDWRAPVEDCSTDSFNCLRVVGHMDIAFPKKCADIAGQTSWDTPVGKYRVVAPLAHYGLPYGTYVSSTYPSALLFYRRGSGFSEVRLTRATPSDAAFDPNDFTKEYNLVVKGQDNLFQCAD